MKKIIAKVRLFIGLAIIIFIWLGHKWALYLMVTLCWIFCEIVGYMLDWLVDMEKERRENL